jgi:hypothetical protein
MRSTASTRPRGKSPASGLPRSFRRRGRRRFGYVRPVRDRVAGCAGPPIGFVVGRLKKSRPPGARAMESRPASSPPRPADVFFEPLTPHPRQDDRAVV